MQPTYEGKACEGEEACDQLRLIIASVFSLGLAFWLACFLGLLLGLRRRVGWHGGQLRQRAVSSHE